MGPAADSLPPFPSPSPGIPRMRLASDLEAGIRYWAAVHLRALAQGDRDLARTASGLKLSYELAFGTAERDDIPVSLADTSSSGWRAPQSLTTSGVLWPVKRIASHSRAS